ncbi:MAG: NUDIX domain-containing protein [Alphaproteobacteria bacterium]|nr:MAG: NUDIX domain-containing protein [Alphaproteobacteria bacterium]
MAEFSDPRVKIIERTSPYRGYFRVDRYRLCHRRFDGGWSGEMSRECFERGHAAAVLPYDPVRDAVVLVEQFRIGAFAAGMDPWLIEIVAGIIEPGESAHEVARREAMEEAGCRVEALIPIAKVLVSPGVMSETVQLFCGRTDSAGLGGYHGVADEHEDIRAFVVPADEALAYLAAGRIVNATALIALQWLALNRPRLRRDWPNADDGAS